MEKKNKKIILIIIIIYIVGLIIVLLGGLDSKLYGVVPEWLTDILITVIYFPPLKLIEFITTKKQSTEGITTNIQLTEGSYKQI